MQINKKLTISLSENDVKIIIANWAASEGYNVKPDDVTLSVGNKWVGYGRDEQQVPCFKECIINVKDPKGEKV